MRTHDPRSGGAQGMDGRYNAGRSGAPGPHTHGNTATQVVDDRRAEVRGREKPSNDPRKKQHKPRYANYWPPLMHKRHIPPHSAQPWHTNHWAPRTRKQHQQEHRPQRPTERSDATQHAKGGTGDCPGPRKETATRRNVTQGEGGSLGRTPLPGLCLKGRGVNGAVPERLRSGCRGCDSGGGGGAVTGGWKCGWGWC